MSTIKVIRFLVSWPKPRKIPSGIQGDFKKQPWHFSVSPTIIHSLYRTNNLQESVLAARLKTSPERHDERRFNEIPEKLPRLILHLRNPSDEHSSTIDSWHLNHLPIQYIKRTVLMTFNKKQDALILLLNRMYVCLYP